MKERTKRQKAIMRRRIFLSAIAAVAVAGIVAICFAVSAIIKNIGDGNEPYVSGFENSSMTSSVVSSGDNVSSNKNTSSNDGKNNSTGSHGKVAASATVVNTGDIILHSTVLDGAKTSDGNYDFSAFFKQSESYFKSADFATANLEVTLGGTESGAFSGYPAFNAPDSVLDAIKNSGIDFLTTANNHCYDTGLFGLKRTVQQLKAKNMGFIGTKEVDTDPKYTVKNINGIKIGMTAYTYENSSAAGQKSINGNIVNSQAAPLINSFNYDRINEFYAEAQSVISDMKNSGAKAIVFYMHWGEEYRLANNTWQKTIAQKLCNMGVNVIVGSHPHVIQPIELIYSEDSQNTAVCIYSMGNAISNQRKELMNPECTTGHTEDGMLFYYTFEKYDDGEVTLAGVDIIPTWVNKYHGGSGYQYTMYPLENSSMAESYGFDAATSSLAKASFERTKQQISKGLYECQNYLGCKIRFAE